ncbi:unnamed protein product [Moneuplotes crassus]|uniref:Uncharacterized protein n=1 Tax=Euplotes crassus TaxID=5936 RepID=A0AAD1XGK9_EUPCR|nr:unnamed protein product [Moneuplotes crassus]
MEQLNSTPIAIPKRKKKQDVQKERQRKGYKQPENLKETPQFGFFKQEETKEKKPKKKKNNRQQHLGSMDEDEMFYDSGEDSDDSDEIEDKPTYKPQTIKPQGLENTANIMMGGAPPKSKHKWEPPVSSNLKDTSNVMADLQKKKAPSKKEVDLQATSGFAPPAATSKSSMSSGDDLKATANIMLKAKGKPKYAPSSEDNLTATPDIIAHKKHLAPKFHHEDKKTEAVRKPRRVASKKYKEGALDQTPGFF